MEVLKVASQSNPKSVAGALTAVLREKVGPNSRLSGGQLTRQ